MDGKTQELQDSGHSMKRSFIDGNERVRAASQASLRKLVLASGLCFLFMVGEFVGGLLANSLAILTDSAHLLSDLLGFGISIAAVLIGRRPASTKTSYGYHRTEVLGALASVSLIWALTLVLIYEAVLRVITPQEVDGLIMLITAGCGLMINIVLTKVLHQHHGHSHGHDHHHVHSHHHDKSALCDPEKLNQEDELSHFHHKEAMNINVKAAFIHVIGDLVQSVGVLTAAIIIYCKPSWHIADPICTFLFSVLVVCTTIPILRECLSILLEQTPGNVNIAHLSEDLEGIQGVVELHDLHVWSLSAGKTSMSCHLQSGFPGITLVKATKLCKLKYNISHTTIQVEPTDEEGSVLDCSNTLH